MARHGNGPPLPSASIAAAKRLFFQTLYTHMTETSTQFESMEVASDDMDLVHASKNGDVAAFEQLVKRYDRKLFRIAQSVTHNTEDAQGAVQDAFLKVFQNLGQFRGLFAECLDHSISQECLSNRAKSSHSSPVTAPRTQP